MELLEQLDALGPTLGGVLAGIGPEQLDDPTPCANFTVGGVLDHMVTGATTFAAAFGGQPPAPDPDDPLTSIGPALGALTGAIAAPGALDRTIDTPFGPMAGPAFARYVVLDGLIHGWDLATATGQDYEPPDELVAAASAFAHEILDPLRDGDTFAAPTEPRPGATAIESLAAYTGRET
jgi:uncharacterized protein (TIGR03086 family)